MDEAGLKLIAEGVSSYLGDMNKAEKANTGFYGSLDNAPKHANSFQQVITGALREVGAAAVRFGIEGAKAIGAFVGDAVGLAGDFESGMLTFQSVAGKEVDTAGLEEFRDLFLQIGKELPVSTSEVQLAATEMVKGGIDPATIAAGGLRQNIQFAAAAMDGDLVKAAEISSKIMGGWAGVGATAAEKAEFLTHATDLLAKAANASSTDVEGLSLGIFNAQGIARTAGVSFDDLTTTLAALAPRFASSSEAGNSLKNMIARLQPTTKPATAAMEGLGLYTEETGSKFYDAQGNFVGFEQAAQLLQESLKGLTKEQQALALQTIFGNDAMGSASALAELGAAGYQEMAGALANANGVADTAALKQQGYNVALDNAKGSVEALQITLGTGLLPLLTDLLNNYVSPGINALSSFAESFMKMVPAIQASDDPLQTFLNALKIAAPGMFDLIVAIEDIKDAITPAVQEIMRLSDALSSGGIGGLIDALTEDITAALPDIQAALLSWGQAFVDWVAPMIPPLIDALADLAIDVWGWIQDEAPGWGEQLQAWGQELVAWIAPMIPPALAELGKLGMALLGWIGDQAAPLLAELQAWATSFVAWIPGATVTFLAEWPKMFDEFLDWIGEAAGPLLLQLGDWALSFIGWIAPMIPGFLVALAGIALAVTTWIGETALVLANKVVGTWIPALVGWIVTEAIPKLYVALNDFLEVFQGWIEDAQTDLAIWMREAGSSLVSGLKQGVSSAWSSFSSWLLGKASDLISDFLANWGAASPAKEWMPVGQYAVQGLMQGFEDMWPSLTELVSGLSDDLIETAAGIGESIQDAIAGGFGAVASIDRQLASNLEKLAKIPEGFYRKATELQLKAAEDQAKAFADPATGAKFFAMRSKQILEFQELQQKINEETDADTKKRLQQQQILILAAQEAEQSAFLAANPKNESALDDIAKQIGLLFNNQNLQDLQKQFSEAKNDAERARIQALINEASIPVNDTGIGADLNRLLTQLQIASGSYAPPPGAIGGAPISTTNTTNLNMPIYTNQSSSVLQSSMAIAGAALL